MPWFWLDKSKHDPAALFGDKDEGFLAPVLFGSDTHRLQVTGTECLVSMTRTVDDQIVRFSPPVVVPLNELRFLRDDLRELVADTVGKQPDEPALTPGQTLLLPPNTRHVAFAELAHLIALALWPMDESSSEDLKMTYGTARLGLDSELERAAKSGQLPVLNPLTLGQQTVLHGRALLSGLVSVEALRIYLENRLTVIVADPPGGSARAASIAAQSTTAALPLPAGPIPGEPRAVNPVQQSRPVQTRPVFSMKKAALVERYRDRWPTIESDLSDASTNGLAAAKAGKRDWWEAVAVEWARSRRKLAAEQPQTTSLSSAMHNMTSLPTKTHRMGR
nr:hypothetical protein [Variovorax boronicumulans]